MATEVKKTPVLNSRKSSIDVPESDLDTKETVVLPEPLLTENEDRFVIFPIKHNDLWKKYKDHVAIFWKPEEIDLAKDMKDWEKTKQEYSNFLPMAKNDAELIQLMEAADKKSQVLRSTEFGIQNPTFSNALWFAMRESGDNPSFQKVGSRKTLSKKEI